MPELRACIVDHLELSPRQMRSLIAASPALAGDTLRISRTAQIAEAVGACLVRPETGEILVRGSRKFSPNHELGRYRGAMWTLKSPALAFSAAEMLYPWIANGPFDCPSVEPMERARQIRHAIGFARETKRFWTCRSLWMPMPVPGDVPAVKVTAALATPALAISLLYGPIRARVWPDSSSATCSAIECSLGSPSLFSTSNQLPGTHSERLVSLACLGIEFVFFCSSALTLGLATIQLSLFPLHATWFWNRAVQLRELSKQVLENLPVEEDVVDAYLAEWMDG